MQRKHGTTRRSPRRSRTAKAARVNRHAAKSRCAGKWDGWGQVSDDGPGHYNPDRSEGPWGRVMYVTRMAVFHRVASCDTERRVLVPQRRTRRTRANHAARWVCRELALPSALRGNARSDKPALKPYRGKPAVRISGGTMETSASFEACSAPSSYPTRGDGRWTFHRR
jgi:hypothetical protein